MSRLERCVFIDREVTFSNRCANITRLPFIFNRPGVRVRIFDRAKSVNHLGSREWPG
jgi:hypothetical protein